MENNIIKKKLKGQYRHILGVVGTFAVAMGVVTQTDVNTMLTGIEGIVAGVVGIIGVITAMRLSWKDKDKDVAEN